MRFVIFAAVCVLALCSFAAAETITDTDCGFTLELPEGFTQWPTSGNVLYTFSTSDPADGTPAAAVSITDLGGQISREAMPLPRNSPPGAHFVPVKWRHWDLQMLAQQNVAFGHTVVTRAVQVPLRNHAIQIILLTPGDQEATADATMAKFLAGLDGAASWATPEQEASDRQGAYVVIGVMCAVPVVFFFVWKLFRWRWPRRPVPDSKKSRQNGALKIAIVTVLLAFFLIYLGSFVAILLGYGQPFLDDDDMRRRVELLSSGAMKMSLWIGALTYGVARLIYRVRRGPVPTLPPQLPPLPPLSPS